MTSQTAAKAHTEEPTYSTVVIRPIFVTKTKIIPFHFIKTKIKTMFSKSENEIKIKMISSNTNSN